MDFGQPNAEIVQKMANNRLLFLARKMYTHIMLTYVFNESHYSEPALVKSTDDTAGAMVSFDEHLPLIQSRINPFVIIPKCISYGVIRGDVTATVGPGPTRTNAEKLEILVQELRNIVFQKGIESFKRILHVIRTEQTFVKVADEIERKHHSYVHMYMGTIGL